MAGGSGSLVRPVIKAAIFPGLILAGTSEGTGESIWDFNDGNGEAERFFSSSRIAASYISEVKDARRVQWTATTPIPAALGAAVLVQSPSDAVATDGSSTSYYWKHIFSDAMDAGAPSMAHAVSIDMEVDDMFNIVVDVSSPSGSQTLAASYEGGTGGIMACRLFAFLPFGKSTLVSRMYALRLPLQLGEGGDAAPYPLPIYELNYDGWAYSVWGEGAPSAPDYKSPTIAAPQFLMDYYGETPLAFWRGQQYLASESSGTATASGLENSTIEFRLLRNGDSHASSDGESAAAFHYGLDPLPDNSSHFSFSAFYLSNNEVGLYHGLVRAREVSNEPHATIAASSLPRSAWENPSTDILAGCVWLDGLLKVHFATEMKAPLLDFDFDLLTQPPSSGASFSLHSTRKTVAPITSTQTTPGPITPPPTEGNRGTPSPSQMGGMNGDNASITPAPTTANACKFDSDCIAMVRSQIPNQSSSGVNLCGCYAASLSDPFDECEGQDDNNCKAARCENSCEGYTAYCGLCYECRCVLQKIVNPTTPPPSHTEAPLFIEPSSVTPSPVPVASARITAAPSVQPPTSGGDGSPAPSKTGSNNGDNLPATPPPSSTTPVPTTANTCTADSDCSAVVRTRIPDQSSSGVDLCDCYAASETDPFDECEGQDDCMVAQCENSCEGYTVYCGLCYECRCVLQEIVNPTTPSPSPMKTPLYIQPSPVPPAPAPVTICHGRSSTTHIPLDGCREYVRCFDENQIGPPQPCAPGLLFDSSVGYCNSESAVICDAPSYVPTLEPTPKMLQPSSATPTPVPIATAQITVVPSVQVSTADDKGSPSPLQTSSNIGEASLTTTPPSTIATGESSGSSAMCTADIECTAMVRSRYPTQNGSGIKLCECYGASITDPFDECEGEDGSICMMSKCEDSCAGLKSHCLLSSGICALQSTSFSPSPSPTNTLLTQAPLTSVNFATASDVYSSQTVSYNGDSPPSTLVPSIATTISTQPVIAGINSDDSQSDLQTDDDFSRSAGTLLRVSYHALMSLLSILLL